jgi:hypothetical protein
MPQLKSTSSRASNSLPTVLPIFVFHGCRWNEHPVGLCACHLVHVVGHCLLGWVDGIGKLGDELALEKTGSQTGK